MLGFQEFHSKFLSSRVFQLIQSDTEKNPDFERVQIFSEKEHAGQNGRLLTKIDDYCSQVRFRFWLFLASFRVLANFMPGLQLLVTAKALNK